MAYTLSCKQLTSKNVHVSYSLSSINYRLSFSVLQPIGSHFPVFPLSGLLPSAFFRLPNSLTWSPNSFAFFYLSFSIYFLIFIIAVLVMASILLPQVLASFLPGLFSYFVSLYFCPTSFLSFLLNSSFCLFFNLSRRLLYPTIYPLPTSSFYPRYIQQY